MTDWRYNMFDMTSRQELEESFGYERYVIETCLREERERQGTASPLILIFDDQRLYETRHELGEHIQLGGSEIGFSSALSPLLFCASYKILDMIIEWVIKENHQPCPYTFKEKINLLSLNTLTFPDPLQADSQLLKTLIACYINLCEFRNAIIHRNWGKINNGDLQFIDKTQNCVGKIITLNEVKGFGDVVVKIGNLLVGPIPAIPRMLDAIRLQFNEICDLHQKPLFSVSIPRCFRVVRRTSKLPFTVDISRMRPEVGKQSGNLPYEFALRVEVGTEGQETVWEIPPEAVPVVDFPLDSSFEKYKLELPINRTKISRY